MTAVVQYLGGKTLGDAMPEVAAATAIFTVPIDAQIAGIIAAQARIAITPPSLAGNLLLAQQLVTQLEAAIALGGALPGVDFQVAALDALLVELQGQLAAIAGLTAALGAGVHVFASTGDAASVAPGGQVPPGALPTSPSGAITLMAVTPAARATLGAFFGASI